MEDLDSIHFFHEKIVLDNLFLKVLPRHVTASPLNSGHRGQRLSEPRAKWSLTLQQGKGPHVNHAQRKGMMGTGLRTLKREPSTNLPFAAAAAGGPLSFWKWKMDGNMALPPAEELASIPPVIYLLIYACGARWGHLSVDGTLSPRAGFSPILYSDQHCYFSYLIN